VLGGIYDDLGQAPVAQQFLEDELSRARSADELHVTLPHLGQLARTLMAQGKEAAAMAIFQEFLALIDRISYAHMFGTMPLLFACQWLAARSGEAAQVCLRQLERVGAQFNSPETATALDEARGYVALAEGDPAEAVGQFRQAAGRWQAMGRPYDQARALNSLGHALLKAGDAAEAFITFELALGLCDSLAVQLDQPGLRVSFLNSPLLQEIQAGRAAC
jgi:tetratricopeptide (TPR) repeat protein